MRMKPKSTVHNPRALLYKRFTDVETSEAFRAIYRTENDGDIAFWVFNAETAKFERANGLLVGEYTTVIDVDDEKLYRYGNFAYRWTITSMEDEPTVYGWERYDLSSAAELEFELLSVNFNNIAKYQTNKYYYAGSFDYMIRGSVGSQDTQYIKGNIMHLRSFEIKHFDDSINIDHDDLVVIEGRLYSVSDLTYDIKRSPKPYTVYFATLNNIL